MIVEIKDMPSGRKIKNISIDISFDDDTISIGQVPKPVQTYTPSPVYSAEVQTSTQDISSQTTVTPAADTMVPPREKKDIPQEMKDIEF